MELYEIMKHEGLGVQECPIETSGTGIIFKDKEEAEKESNRLWLENTTEEDRNSSWCYLKYSVKKVVVR